MSNILKDSHDHFGEYTSKDLIRMRQNEGAREFQKWNRSLGDCLKTYSRVENLFVANPGLRANPGSRISADDVAVHREFAAANEALVQMRDVVGGVPHVDATLANLSIKFMNEEYIGAQLMPIAPVAKQSDRYAVFSDRDYLAYPDAHVGPRGDVQQLSTNIDLTPAYYCHEFALEEYVDLSNIANADAPIDLLANAVYKCNDGLEWNREKEIAAVLTATASFGTNYLTIAAGDEWDSAGGGSPIKNIQDAAGNCLGGPGATDLVGYCGFNVYKVLARHPEIRDLFKYTGSGLASPQLLASIFGLDRLLVGKAWQDTANPGQTIGLDRIWGEIFGVVRVARAPMPNMYSFGMTFDWQGKNTEVFFDRSKGRRGGYRPKVSDAWTPKVVAPRAGYLLTNCLA